MKFLFPIDGDVLFSVADGVEKADGLHTVVKVKAPAGKTIRIGGADAAEENGEYSAEVVLDAYRNTVEAVDTETDEMISMVIYWFKNGYQTYRMCVDDVVWCFRNIWKHQDTYKSVFEDPFLGFFKEMHVKYGTYVHLHLFYATIEGDFNLSMFPDKYKPEFTANSDWLKMTFHARQEMPDMLYKDADYEEMMHDGRQVEREILRFAGSEVMTNVTSLHWSEANRHGIRALHNMGYKCIEGYFELKDGAPWVSLYLDEEQTLHAGERDFWMDNSENELFVKCDVILNELQLDEIIPHLEALSAKPKRCFHYLMIHEQYFYEDYFAYEPDYRERVECGIRWCCEHGYRPALISQIAFEPPYNR